MSRHEAGPARAVASAKLHPPALVRRLVQRPRLLDAVDDQPASVTLVCGPAGAGKTTLLSAWAAVPGRVVAWLDLDQHDNDPFRLWRSVLASLSSSGAFPADSRIHALEPMHGGTEGTLLAAVEEAVDALDAPLWLVLDDVHELTDPAVLASLDLLLRHLPQRLRVVLSTRTDPPVSLQRMRLSGDLRELRFRDLAFTRAEMLELLRAHAVALDDDAADALLDRTEGWAAGLQIAALALAGEPDPGAFVARFGEHDRTVADYLIEEVLARLPEDVRWFLLRVSTCGEIPVDLAEVLSGRRDAGALLDRLERDNVLILRLDRGATVYRSNELLRTYLQAALRRQDRAAYEELHRVASEWYQERGQGGHALEHAVVAHQYDVVLAWLRRYGVGLLLDHQLHRLATLLGAVPEPWAAAPLVALLRAQLALATGDLAVADRAIADAEAALHGDDPWLVMLRGVVAVHRASTGGTLATALEQLDALPDAPGRDGGDLELLRLHHRGMGRAILGDNAAAAADLERVVDLATAAEQVAVAVSALAMLAVVSFDRGAYAAMHRHAGQALALAQPRGWTGSSLTGLAHLTRATASYLLGEREDAGTHAELAVIVLGNSPDGSLRLGARFLQAMTSLDGGATPYEAVRSIRTAWDAVPADTVGLPAHMLVVPAEVQLNLLAGDVAGAATAAARTVERFPTSAEAALVTAQLQLGRGHHDDARAVLRTTLGADGPPPANLTLVRLLLLETELAALHGEDFRAFDALTTALEAAGDSGLIRPFLDAGAVVHELLLVNVGRFGHAEPLVARILAARVPDRDPAPLVDRLTTSELKVLLDLPSLATIPEIAAARCVSVNTVKTHLRSIYRKLDVANRRGAVEEARRRGLL